VQLNAKPIGLGESFSINITIDESNIIKFEAPNFLTEFDAKIITKTSLTSILNKMFNNLFDHYNQ